MIILVFKKIFLQYMSIILKSESLKTKKNKARFKCEKEKTNHNFPSTNQIIIHSDNYYAIRKKKIIKLHLTFLFSITALT